MSDEIDYQLTQLEKGQVMVLGAKIILRNFAGEERTYNRKGDRNFLLVLNERDVEPMLADGWNVKRMKPREDDELGTPHLQVTVGVDKGRPPRVRLITRKNKTDIFGPAVEMLDWADIKNVDLILNPYHWDVNGKTGIKAYLKSIYVTIHEDELDLIYEDLPLAGSTPHNDLESEDFR